VIDQLVKAPPIGEARDRELLKDAYSFVYFNSPHGDLAVHIFIPPGHDPDTAKAPVIAFFHGGLWDSSMPTQFVPHCLHFASRGAVTLCVDYRVKSKHDVTPVEAVEDASMLYLFLNKNAHLLGIDTGRIVFAGAGSGAHLALCCATLPEIGGEPGEYFRPRALFLFSPIVNTTRKGVGAERFPTEKIAKRFSPSEFVRKGLPPLLVFHAQQDRVVPIDQVRRFTKRYTRKKNQCELLDFASAGHTFFNYNSHQQNYEITLRCADHFLVDLGILEPDPLAGEF
jgi:acetyl esterase